MLVRLVAKVLPRGLPVALAFASEATFVVRSLAFLQLAAVLAEVHPALALVVAGSVVVALALASEAAFVVRVLAVLFFAAVLAEVHEAFGVVLCHTSAFAVSVAKERLAGLAAAARICTSRVTTVGGSRRGRMPLRDTLTFAIIVAKNCFACEKDTTGERLSGVATVSAVETATLSRGLPVALALASEAAFVVRVLAVLFFAAVLAEVHEAFGVVLCHTSAFAVSVAKERLACETRRARSSGGIVWIALLRAGSRS